ncbi:nitroreductase/quinone reductase family protein [Planobispora takensis]|uniref:DUF385 domain-containing protein n=2 Tax=Planobispora takensis TaxID=1367882 RepID=A0A8J3WV05_9ACTN|nr:hypothetical protein Pta02_41910 [Planobispora takensis]
MTPHTARPVNLGHPRGTREPATTGPPATGPSDRRGPLGIRQPVGLRASAAGPMDRGHPPGARGPAGVASGGPGWRRLLDATQNRVVNPVVRGLLRSPVHDLVSASVVLLTMRGRVSGREIAVPAGYVERDGELLLISRRERQWWRNLRDGAPVRVLLRGREWNATARTSAEPEQVVETLMAMAADRPSGAAQSAWARDGVAIRIRLGDPIPRARITGLWWRWFRATVLGEVAGFVLPAVVAALIAGSPGFGPLALAALMILAGAGEGAVLGLAQAWALRGALPAVPTRSWVRATAAGAALAWSAAVPLMVGRGAEDVSWPVLVVMGMIALTSIGLSQWRLLRGHLARAWQWVVASAGGWCMGLAAFGLVTTPLWQPGQPAVLVALIGMLGGLVMAATVAAVTATTLVRLVR